MHVLLLLSIQKPIFVHRYPQQKHQGDIIIHSPHTTCTMQIQNAMSWYVAFEA